MKDIIPIIYVALPTYLLLSGFGLFVAVPFARRRLLNHGVQGREFVEYGIVSAICGLVVSRLFFVLSKLPSMDGIEWKQIFHYFLNGGIVFYGGLIGVMIGCVLVAKRRKRDPAFVLDMVAPAFPLFHIFGRIGCLFAGCCYGIECSWGVIMAEEPEIVRFPVQLVESVCNLIIFVILFLGEKKRGNYQNNLWIYLSFYSLCRFVLEFFRGDSVRGIWFGVLSSSQIVAVFILCIGAIHRIRKRQAVTACKE